MATLRIETLNQRGEAVQISVMKAVVPKRGIAAPASPA
jgi:hypothetical protein